METVTEAQVLYADKNRYLRDHYPEVDAGVFYREIFPEGSFERAGHPEDARANGILRDLSGDRPITYIVTDDLSAIQRVQGCPMAVMGGAAYSGRTNTSTNARWLYALIIDLDYLTELKYLVALCGQYESHFEYIPRPTFLVNSGNGMHLYYVFEDPVPMYSQIQVAVRELKYQLIRKVWNRYTSSRGEEKDLQRQGIMQGFRVVGSLSKLGVGYPVRAFRTGQKVSLAYLNRFVEPKYQVTGYQYKSSLTLAQAKDKYPEWYERRIERGEKKGRWTVKRDLYDWWLRQILSGATVGHRYYCVMCLAIYALKCSIGREELEKDAYGLLNYLNDLDKTGEHPFTRLDVEEALHLYNEPYETYPRSEVERVSGIPIVPQIRRNGRRQIEHLQADRWRNIETGRPAVNVCKQNRELVLQEMREKGEIYGRPKGSGTKAQQVQEWRRLHPEGTKSQCKAETGLTYPTIRKWWKENRSHGTDTETDRR